MQPLITVLMPVFNGSAVVRRAIDSILRQTFSDWEFVIVDDGSTDETVSHIKTYEDPRIRLFQRLHAGIAPTLNHGLQMARGRYIARMDADDESHPDRLLLQFQFLENHPEIGAVACQVAYKASEVLPHGYRNYVDWTNSLIAPGQIANARFTESPLAHPSILFHKILIEQHGAYSEAQVPEDYELWLRWMDKGVEIAKIDRFLLTWYDRSDRLSRVDDHYSEAAFYQVKARYFMSWYRQYGEARPVFVWGHGRIMRRRVNWFQEAGLQVSGFIDIKQRDHPDFIHFESSDRYQQGIVLGFVADLRGKAAIMAHLQQLGMAEGEDFFQVA